VRFPSSGVRSGGVVEWGIERIDVRCRFSCFLRYLASSFDVPVRSPASARVVYGRRVAGGEDFMAASFAPVGPSWSIGGGASPLLLTYCGFADFRDGLCFFSGIGGGGNMRLVPGSACLVGAARPPWNKFTQVSVHLAVMCSSGGGGSVGLVQLGSKAPRRDSDGVESGLFFFLDYSLFFPFLLLLVLRVQVAGQEKARGKTVSKGSTADGRLRRMCCSFLLFGPSFQGIDGGGLQLVRAVWRADVDRWPGRRWKIYNSSRDLVVILLFLGVLSAKVGYTDPFASS